MKGSNDTSREKGKAFVKKGTELLIDRCARSEPRPTDNVQAAALEDFYVVVYVLSPTVFFRFVYLGILC